MILTDIEEKLQQFGDPVYYGMVDEAQAQTVWNYIVFNRVAIQHSPNKTSDVDRFDVHIIRENFIPDGMEDAVMEKLREISGVRLTNENSVFSYVQKPNTNVVVEMLTIPFVRARKSRGSI